MDTTLEPENVAVVINADSWASAVLADAYVKLRRIPPDNVITVSGLSSFESIGIDEFRERILVPVLAALERRGLRDKIDCLAYSADMPYFISFRSDLVDGTQRSPVAGDGGALTGLTYLYEAVQARAPQLYTALDSNFYARRAYVGETEPPMSPAEMIALREAERLAHRGDPAAAVAELEKFCEQYPKRVVGHYLRTLALASSGKPEAAAVALEAAIAAGWYNTEATESDPRLAPLRSLPAWAKLREGIETNRLNLKVQPPCRFRAGTAWDSQGQPTTEPGGRRYLLSTMLGATSGRGTSLREAIDILARSAAADGTRPSGTIYYMTNDDIRTRTRRWGFEAAIRLLKEAGVAAVIDTRVLPEGREDIAGAMVGIANFDVAAARVRILPGAICEHLTSGGGIVAWGDGQTPLTEFLRHGAAGAAGTVIEPYAIQAKFPDPFIQVHYVRGASLAEAFYQSVTGPYQLLIMGDPLCRPWGKPRTSAAAKPARFPLPGVAAPVKGDGRPKNQVVGRGFRVIDANGVHTVSGGKGLQPWWQAAAIVPDSELTIDGYIEVGTNGVHQFQVRSSGDVKLTVSGQDLPATGKGPWRTYPVELRKGWHSVRLAVKAGGAKDRPTDPPLELNFGAVGTPPLIPQLWYYPRRGDQIHNVGITPQVIIPEMTDDPLALTLRFAVNGLQPPTNGKLKMRWELPADSGWVIEPVQAETPVVKGVVEPFPFRVHYRGAPFLTNDFFRLGKCHMEMQTGFGAESVDSVGFPLELILKERPRQQVRVPRAVKPPKLDGVLDDELWSGPAMITKFIRPGLDAPLGQPTAAWLAWDDRNLYLAARCTEPNLGGLRLGAKKRDDPVFGDDSVELLLAFDDEAKKYYQVVVNAAGLIYDGIGYDSSWNGDFQVATGREDGAWTVELAVPWSTLGAAAPKPGTALRVLVGRNRYTVNPGEVSTWPAAPGGNHQPRLFSRAVLGGS